MVAGGAPKNVDFLLDGISPSDGKFVLRLQLYKGTNNNGCFYGLTGVVLKGSLGEATLVEDIAASVQQGNVYDLTGRRVLSPEKGIYIVDGVKKVVK